MSVIINKSAIAVTLLQYPYLSPDGRDRRRTERQTDWLIYTYLVITVVTQYGYTVSALNWVTSRLPVWYKYLNGTGITSSTRTPYVWYLLWLMVQVPYKYPGTFVQGNCTGSVGVKVFFTVLSNVENNRNNCTQYYYCRFNTLVCTSTQYEYGISIHTVYMPVGNDRDCYG